MSDWPEEPTDWPPEDGFPTGKPLPCEATAIRIADDARSLAETHKMLMADSRASEFQLRYFRTGAMHKIIDLVSYMEKKLPPNYVHRYRDMCKTYVYGVQDKIADTIGSDPPPTRTERIRAGLDTFGGPFSMKTGLAKTREFRVHSGVHDCTRMEIRQHSTTHQTEEAK